MEGLNARTGGHGTCAGGVQHVQEEYRLCEYGQAQGWHLGAHEGGGPGMAPWSPRGGEGQGWHLGAHEGLLDLHL